MGGMAVASGRLGQRLPLTGRHQELVLQDRRGVANVCIEIEIRVVGHGDDGHGIGGRGVVQLPLVVLRDSVRHVDLHVARKALLSVRRQSAPGDRLSALLRNLPDMSVPADPATRSSSQSDVTA